MSLSGLSPRLRQKISATRLVKDSVSPPSVNGAWRHRPAIREHPYGLRSLAVCLEVAITGRESCVVLFWPSYETSRWAGISAIVDVANGFVACPGVGPRWPRHSRGTPELCPSSCHLRRPVGSRLPTPAPSPLAPASCSAAVC